MGANAGGQAFINQIVKGAVSERMLVMSGGIGIQRPVLLKLLVRDHDAQPVAVFQEALGGLLIVHEVLQYIGGVYHVVVLAQVAQPADLEPGDVTALTPAARDRDRREVHPGQNGLRMALVEDPEPLPQGTAKVEQSEITRSVEPEALAETLREDSRLFPAAVPLPAAAGRKVVIPPFLCAQGWPGCCTVRHAVYSETRRAEELPRDSRPRGGTGEAPVPPYPSISMGIPGGPAPFPEGTGSTLRHTHADEAGEAGSGVGGRAAKENPALR